MGRSIVPSRRRFSRWTLAGLLVAPLGCASGAVATSGLKPPGVQIAPAGSAAVPPGRGCRPASLQRQAAATLIVGLPDTLTPADPLAVSMPALGVGGIFLNAANVRSPNQVRSLVTAIRVRRGAPLVVATDEEGGRVTSFASVLGYRSSARALAPLGPTELRKQATTLGRQLRALGVNVDFAPDLDVTGGAWDAPIGDRSYSADPSTVSTDALAVARGLAAGGVTPVLKHFPGLGRADADTHLTTPVVAAPAWQLIFGDMRPFIDAIGAGAPAVMVGHAEYPALGDTDLPASLSPKIYSTLRAVSFRGVAITDSLGMGAVNLRFDFPVAAVRALAAGSDGLLTTDANQALRMRDAIVTAVHNHQLSPARLADAAGRVTALAGADSYALTCIKVTLPRLH